MRRGMISGTHGRPRPTGGYGWGCLDLERAGRGERWTGGQKGAGMAAAKRVMDAADRIAAESRQAAKRAAADR